MNIALVLSGGTGVRMGLEVPKQYQILAGKPVIVHTLEQFEGCPQIDHVIAVAASDWEETIWEWKGEHGLSKLKAVAAAGEDRQRSIRNGLMAARPLMEDRQGGVIIQDAVRPLTSRALLTRLVQGLEEAPAVMILPTPARMANGWMACWTGAPSSRARPRRLLTIGHF